MIVATAGHRPDKITPGGWKDFGFHWADLVLFARECLREHEVHYVVSGMALGWDQALAEAARLEEIPYTAAVPFPTWNSMWTNGEKLQAARLLDNADEIVTVHGSTPSTGTFGYVMQKRNRYMVDYIQEHETARDASAVLALYNGSKGGTANCIKYAREQCVPVINVWDAWQKRLGRAHVSSDTRIANIAKNMMKKKGSSTT